MKRFSVAIDGPAGAGKSSIAKEVAKRLGCIYVDTGAMYRSVGLYCLKEGIDINDEKAVSKALCSLCLNLKPSDLGQQIFLNGENVSQAIRNDEVAAAASKVATYEKVRASLVKKQQEMEKEQSIVMDGRDIGTVVLPHATLKIFLTASVEERAKRRLKEYEEKGRKENLAVLMEEIQKRDTQDMNRLISPLKKAEDAHEVDTTYMEIEVVIQTVIQKLKAKLGEE